MYIKIKSKWLKEIAKEFRFKPDSRVPTAGVTIEGSYPTIIYNPEWVDSLSTEDVETLFKHEIMHLIREDVFVENYDRELFNLATDAIINKVLNIRKIGNIMGIHYDDIKKIFKDAPDWVYGWKPLYDYLDEIGQKIAEAIDHVYPVEPTDEAIDAIRRIRTKIRRLENECKKEGVCDKDLQKIVNEVKGQTESLAKHIQKSAGRERGKYIIKIEKKSTPLLRRFIEEVLKIIEDEEGEEFQLKRTWLREGRIPELPREIELPILSVLFIIDVSGSFVNYAEKEFLPALQYLSLYDIKFDIIVFDNTARKVESYREIRGGGGTNIRPVFEFLKRLNETYSIILFFSDYEFYDVSQNQRNPRFVIENLKGFSDRIICINEQWQVVGSYGIPAPRLK